MTIKNNINTLPMDQPGFAYRPAKKTRKPRLAKTTSTATLPPKLPSGWVWEKIEWIPGEPFVAFSSNKDLPLWAYVQEGNLILNGPIPVEVVRAVLLSAQISNALISG